MGLYILMSSLIILAGALIAIIPQLIFGGTGKSYPKSDNGKSPISFCIGAILLLLVSLLDSWELLLCAGEHINLEDILNCIKLAETLLGCLIAILLICKNYNVFLQFTIMVKLVFLIFNNLAGLDTVMKNFGACFIGTLFCLVEIIVWIGIFKFIAIIRDNEIEQNSKLILLFKVSSFLMIPSILVAQNQFVIPDVVFTSTQKLIINTTISVLEILTLISLTFWFCSPFKKTTEAYKSLSSARTNVKLFSKKNLIFMAIVLCVVLIISLIWAGIGQIKLSSSDMCPHCNGLGMIRTEDGVYDECRRCYGSGKYYP